MKAVYISVCSILNEDLITGCSSKLAVCGNLNRLKDFPGDLQNEILYFMQLVLFRQA